MVFRPLAHITQGLLISSFDYESPKSIFPAESLANKDSLINVWFLRFLVVFPWTKCIASLIFSHLFSPTRRNKSCEGNVWGTSSEDVKCHVNVRDDHFLLTSHHVLTSETFEWISRPHHRFLDKDSHPCTQVTPGLALNLLILHRSFPFQLSHLLPARLHIVSCNLFFPAVPWVFDCHFPGPEAAWRVSSAFSLSLDSLILDVLPLLLWLINFYYWFCVRVFRVSLCLTPVVT